MYLCQRLVHESWSTRATQCFGGRPQTKQVIIYIHTDLDCRTGSPSFTRENDRQARPGSLAGEGLISPREPGKNRPYQNVKNFDDMFISLDQVPALDGVRTDRRAGGRTDRNMP